MKASATALPADAACKALLDEFRARPTIRAGSLITTVFGDAIAPRGGGLWLGSLIRIMADFGISERLVRTSVFRLASDGWLESEQIGRRAFYSLTDDGRERFRAATHRIYRPASDNWDGHWTLVLLNNLAADTRDATRRELGWLGFGAVDKNLLAHPSPDAEDLQATLQRLKISADAVVITGHTVASDDAMRRLAHASWNLDRIDARYRAFVERFEPVYRSASRSASLPAKTAFLVRTLLIQEYRRVLLRDPKLPREMLPDEWHGNAAYRLCRDLYRLTYQAADDYLTETIETRDGTLPPPGEDYRVRFGGLSVTVAS